MSDTNSKLTAEIEDSNPARLSIRDWDLVDLSQRGAAKDASEDIVPLLEEAVGEQTLFVLPEGRYLVDSEFNPDGWDRLGLVGRPHAEIVVTDTEHTFGRCFSLAESGASEAWLENITFDYRAEGVGPAAFGCEVDDSLHVRNVTVDGQCDYISREGRGSSCVYVNVTDPDGSGVVENLTLADGSRFDKELHDLDRASQGYVQNNWGLIGINVYPAHEGTLRFRDCTVAGWPDAGLYAKRSGGNGTVIVEGGHFQNNGAAGVRLSHDDMMIGGNIVKTDVRGWTGPGLWLQEGEPTVRDVTITAYRWGGEVVRISSDAATLDNCTIATSIDTRTIRASGSGSGAGIVFSNCSFRHFGQAAGDYGILVRRGDVTFRDTDFRYVGGEDNPDLKNLVYANQPVRVIDCEFDTPEAGLRLEAAGSDVRGCRFHESEVHLSGAGHERLLCEQNRLREQKLTMSGGTRSAVLERNILE